MTAPPASSRALESVLDNLDREEPAALDRETPQLVDALVAAGARVLEVQPEMPALEDVYLHLVGGHQ